MEPKRSEVGPCGDFLRGGFIEQSSSRAWLESLERSKLEVQEVVLKITLKRKKTANKNR